MTGANNGITEHAFCVGSGKKGFSDETKLRSVVDVAARLVRLESGGEFVGVVEDLLGGAGHGGHLGQHVVAERSRPRLPNPTIVSAVVGQPAEAPWGRSSGLARQPCRRRCKRVRICWSPECSGDRLVPLQRGVCHEVGHRALDRGVQRELGPGAHDAGQLQDALEHVVQVFVGSGHDAHVEVAGTGDGMDLEDLRRSRRGRR
jgi:hypothetical protein